MNSISFSLYYAILRLKVVFGIVDAEALIDIESERAQWARRDEERRQAFLRLSGMANRRTP